MISKLGHFALIASLTLAAVASASAQEQANRGQVKLERVSNNVYMLQGGGANVAAFVSDEGIVLVDCSTGEMAPKIEVALKSVSDRPVKYVINTHWHGDHTGGNAYFEKTAVIVAHDNMRKRMATGHDPRISDLFISLPMITYSEEFTLHTSGGDIRGIHFARGHTDGDTVVFFPPGDVVSTGDDFTNFTPPHFGPIGRDDDGSGGPQGAIAADEYVLDHSPENVKIIPGHGNLGSRADLVKFVGVLKDTTAAVQTGIKSGKSLDELKRQKVLAKWGDWDSTAVPMDTYVERIYKALTVPYPSQ